MSQSILKAQGIFKSYKMGAASVEVLKGLSLTIKEGEFVAIIGSSGSGKSTLLHILGSLDRADSGDVFFDDHNLRGFSNRRLNKFRNSQVGFVFQFYHLLDELNVLENVFLPAMTGMGILGWFAFRLQARQRAATLLEQFGLADRLKHKPWQLSGGERQRVAIARALMNEPQILLADEPTGNLDWQTGNDILNVFTELNKAGQTIIMVTHDQRIAQRAARVITLADGRIVD